MNNNNNRDMIVDRITNISLDVVTKSGKKKKMFFDLNNILDSNITLSNEHEEKRDGEIVVYRIPKDSNLSINVKAKNIECSII